MNCHSVRSKLSIYLDGRLDSSAAREISMHVDQCEDCLQRSQQMQQVRRTLLALAPGQAPELLSTSLRVIASQQRARQLAGVSLRAQLLRWNDYLGLWLNNLARPLALPFAGGLMSAVLLFTTLVSTYPARATSAGDVPTVLYTEAAFKTMGPFDLTNEEIVVDLVIDEQGRMVDYTLPLGQSKDAALRRSIEKTLLFTEFVPATAFGQPISGKIRISFRRGHIDVKG